MFKFRNRFERKNWEAENRMYNQFSAAKNIHDPAERAEAVQKLRKDAKSYYRGRLFRARLKTLAADAAIAITLVPVIFPVMFAGMMTYVFSGGNPKLLDASFYPFEFRGDLSWDRKDRRDERDGTLARYDRVIKSALSESGELSKTFATKAANQQPSTDAKPAQPKANIARAPGNNV